MGRKAMLTDEQVFMLRNDVLKQALKKYSELFGISVPTLIKAKKGRKPYDKDFSVEFEDAMVAKHL